ncbi:hypothetical protein BD779DRAFT_1477664 [Infundibulicybe gibba]|nr:hypothetical protein BD779DRAFT_1477664 [Infundibulicybe gibba]
MSLHPLSPSPSMSSPSTSSSSLLDSGPSLHDHNAFSPANMFNVEGMVVVVTGGGTGIGLMIATALEHNGATVYIAGRREDVLEKAAYEHNKYDKIIPLKGDVTNRDSLLAMADFVKARHGYIDLLINNAGIARNLYSHPLPSPTDSPAVCPLSPPASPTGCQSNPSIKGFQAALWNTGSPDDFAETFATNVTAVYYTTVAFLDLLYQGNLRQQRFAFPTGFSDTPSPPRPPYHTSQVLSVSSSGSFRLDSKVLSPSYTLSKSACTHLGKMLANLLAPWGIRSNVLAPGVWPSDFKLDPYTLADSIPLRRVGTEEDMAGAILFLASRAGAYVNGAVWLVDGGRIGGVASSY